jgi:nitrite reductase (NADH) small subunit
MIKLANKKDIPPGTAITVQGPDGTEIALFNIEGTIYALDNSCPHMGGPLGDGEIENCCVTCPWHGWQFDVKTGACENVPGESAVKIPIEVIGDVIYLPNDTDDHKNHTHRE